MRLPEGEARARFAAVPVARLGTADGQGRPHLVVVISTVDGDVVYTAAGPEAEVRLAAATAAQRRREPGVTMLAEHYTEDWETLWWVRADGRAAILTDRYWRYRQAPPTGPVLTVRVERWTGWSGAGAG